jgi:hypothetical protein
VPASQPLLVRVAAASSDLISSSSMMRCSSSVDQEHAARLEPALAHDRGLGLDVEHADLGCQHDETVVGDPEARRPQAVAVEHCADLGAVGEDDGRRTVPRLHEGGVVGVEGTAGRIHLLVVLPGLRDHHQHGVRQVAPPEVQQLENLVEGGRVARARVQIGKTRERSPGIRSLASWASRARIQLRLPMTVLISPLWAISGTGAPAATTGTCWSRTASARGPAPRSSGGRTGRGRTARAGRW